MEIKRSVHIKDGLEYTTVIYGELLVPKPRQTYLHTRSYADMRAEYDLLTCCEVTDEDVMKVALSMEKISKPVIILTPILIVLLTIAFLNII